MMTLHYDIVGDRDPDILLVHGWASSNRMWRSIVQNFAHIGRLWMPDLPGFGKTPASDPIPGVDDLTAQLIRFCDDHNLRPQLIIAHSMGGLITLKMLHVRPDLAQQLVLICPVVNGNFGLQGLPSEMLRNPLSATVLRQTEALWAVLKQDLWLKAMPIPYDTVTADLIREDMKATDPRVAIECLLTMPQQNMMDALITLDHPTLVAVGLNDITVPPSEGRTAALYMPNAQLATFDQSRHRPHDEQPDDFMPRLRDFLTVYGLS